MWDRMEVDVFEMKYLFSPLICMRRNIQEFGRTCRNVILGNVLALSGLGGID